MNRRTDLATALLTTALAAMSAGCDPEALDQLDHDGEFRSFTDMKGTGPGKLNTNFLGNEALPLNNIPLSAGAQGNIELLAIRATQCIDADGSLLQGHFSTKGMVLEPRVTAEGRLREITVADVNDPSRTCVVQDDLWVDTFWEIRMTKTAQGTIETDLWLTDIGKDARGSMMYAWSVNVHRIDPSFSTRRLPYRPTCDEDTADAALGFHAYLVPNLRVKETSGVFTAKPGSDTMFIACASGAVGKAMQWGYMPHEFGTQTHELATRMVRADYCGDGVSHTQAGTELWLFDNAIYTQEAPEGLVPEAVWSPSANGALCVTRPRLTPLDEDPKPIVCDGVELPACDPNLHYGEIEQNGKVGAMVTSVEAP